MLTRIFTIAITIKLPTPRRLNFSRTCNPPRAPDCSRKHQPSSSPFKSYAPKLGFHSMSRLTHKGDPICWHVFSLNTISASLAESGLSTILLGALEIVQKTSSSAFVYFERRDGRSSTMCNECAQGRHTRQYFYSQKWFPLRLLFRHVEEICERIICDIQSLFLNYLDHSRPVTFEQCADKKAMAPVDEAQETLKFFII